MGVLIFAIHLVLAVLSQGVVWHRLRANVVGSVETLEGRVEDCLSGLRNNQFDGEVYLDG